MSAEPRRTKIAIIGDRFMTPSTFEAAIRARCRQPIDIGTMELPWPDEPMRHGCIEHVRAGPYAKRCGGCDGGVNIA